MATVWQAITRQLAGGGRVFINYRHDQLSGEAGRLFDRLNDRFPGQVFKDFEAITPGSNYEERINRELNSCRAFLVLIGKRWLEADESGQRRIDNPDDWVRKEIATVLQRGICTIPVLVDGAEMPRRDQLPADLGGLASMQAHDLPERYFDPCFDRLVQVLEPQMGKARQHPGEGHKRHWGRRLLFITGVLGLMLFIASRFQKGPAPSEEAAVSSSTILGGNQMQPLTIPSAPVSQPPVIAQPQPRAQDVPAPRVLRYSAKSFSVEHPENWTVAIENEDAVMFCLIGTIRHAVDGNDWCDCAMTARFLSAPGVQLNLNEVTANVIESVTRENPRVEVNGPQAHPGGMGFVTGFRIPTPYNYLQGSVVVTFATPKGVGILRFDAPSDQYKRWSPVFDHFLSSFTPR